MDTFKQIDMWKDIEDYKGLYQVSCFGEVMSLPRNTGNQYSKGKIKETQINKYGYEIVSLCYNNKQKTFSVHRLVAMSFIPNPENKPQVNHKDGNKLNNHVSNLEWCDASKNQKHRYVKLGHTIHNRLLTKNQVFVILSKKGKGWMKDVSREFGVTISCIKAVRSGRNYTDWYNEFKLKSE